MDGDASDISVAKVDFFLQTAKYFLGEIQKKLHVNAKSCNLFHLDFVAVQLNKLIIVSVYVLFGLVWA